MTTKPVAAALCRGGDNPWCRGLHARGRRVVVALDDRAEREQRALREPGRGIVPGPERVRFGRNAGHRGQQRQAHPALGRQAVDRAGEPEPSRRDLELPGGGAVPGPVELHRGRAVQHRHGDQDARAALDQPPLDPDGYAQPARGSERVVGPGVHRPDQLHRGRRLLRQHRRVASLLSGRALERHGMEDRFDAQRAQYVRQRLPGRRVQRRPSASRSAIRTGRTSPGRSSHGGTDRRGRSTPARICPTRPTTSSPRSRAQPRRGAPRWAGPITARSCSAGTAPPGRSRAVPTRLGRRVPSSPAFRARARGGVSRRERRSAWCTERVPSSTS